LLLLAHWNLLSAATAIAGSAAAVASAGLLLTRLLLGNHFVGNHHFDRTALEASAWRLLLGKVVRPVAGSAWK
jgi:hypothetical protein